MSKQLFSLSGRLYLGGKRFDWTNVNFGRLLNVFHTERSWHAYWFSLVGMICPLMQEHFLFWLRIKLGRGQGNGNIETRVWGLGTWGRVKRYLRTRSIGRGNVKNRDAGDAGYEWLSQKSEVNAISSFFVKMCYLWSTLASIFQNHIGHLMMFTQTISLYRD